MKYFILIASIIISFSSIAQLKGIIANQYSHFELIHKKDTIDFVVTDTSLIEIKPVLLFCQGSQPVPLFVDFGAQKIAPITLNNFDINEMRRSYHIVVISMPKTPVIATPEHLNRSYNYVQDTSINHSYDPEYIKADYLENYIDRANSVIKYLFKQKWVDKTNLVVAGHSQGSRVAVGIAHSNKNVTKLGLFGYNPMRRIDQNIWAYRKQAQNGEITWEQADSLQQIEYDFYKEVLNNDSVAAHPELKSWRSFSTCSIAQLTDLNIPIYIAFGSLDNVADYCDLLPMYFAEKNKTNYLLKRYPGLEHNFFPMNEDFRPDYANGKWRDVMNSFIDWSVE